ncbi:hypothetical protein C0993_001307 [Termitomyces sp. T159_Od127]|nr:hypothetical protein C0993_001307 [Termitomyces sp. T159_Od127]
MALFVFNAQLSKSSQVLTTLIDSRATKTFVNDQLDLIHDPLNRQMDLQLFDSKLTAAGPITKTHSSSIILDNGLWFLVNLLVTQLLKIISIILGLSWLCDVNLNIDWKDLTMEFPRLSAFRIAIHLCLRLTNDSSEVRATGTLTAPLDDFGNPPPPQHTLGTPLAFLPNILCNKYEGPNYPIHCSWTTLDTNDVDQPPKLLDPDTLNNKIIGLAPFAHIIQDVTPAFQLHISLAKNT